MVKQIEEHYCDRCGDLIEKPHAGVEIPGTHPSMVGNLYEDCINALPSAFEGMTNRDVLKALFPIDENQGIRYIKVYLDHEPIESFELSTTQKWLDSPYKGASK